MVVPVGNKASEVGVELPRKAQNVESMAAQSTQSAIDPATVGIKAVSPRMRTDSVAAVLITEYLSNDGQIDRQYPSEAAVAYLRSGLMEDGSHETDQFAALTQETLI